MGLETPRHVKMDGWELAEMIRTLARKLGTAQEWSVNDVRRAVDRMAELRKQLDGEER